jgi:hypothetical protein
MAGRIISMQRQARELGRLRTGYTDTSGTKPRPVKSLTWVITSHAENYVQAAADAWGGDLEKWQPLGGGAAQWRVISKAVALDAILPPGDPLSQSYELWSGGGCVRRCDGITETLTDCPCLCRDEHGDDFHEQPKGKVCAATTRLNVFLPDMPDVGVFRVETHSFYAAQEIAGAVDLIRSAVGPDAIIPIRLRIEQRQRKAGGQTKNFPVVVVELRGITTGQVLGASVMGGRELAARAHAEALGAAGNPGAAAIEAGPTVVDAVPDADGKPALTDEQRVTLIGQISMADTLEQVREMWTGIVARFAVDRDDPVIAALTARASALQPPADNGEQTEEQAVKEMTSRRGTRTAPGADADELWAQIQRTAPDTWTSTELDKQFATFAEVDPEVASAGDMQRFLDHLQNGGAK